MIKRYKGAKGKCDKLISAILRLHHSSCERCGSRDWLQTSHIIGRKFSATRTDLSNLQLLCAKCHRYFTDHPVEFTRWLFESIGEPEYDRLHQKAHTAIKLDWDAELIRLKELHEQTKTGSDW